MPIIIVLAYLNYKDDYSGLSIGLVTILMNPQLQYGKYIQEQIEIAVKVLKFHLHSQIQLGF